MQKFGKWFEKKLEIWKSQMEDGSGRVGLSAWGDCRLANTAVLEVWLGGCGVAWGRCKPSREYSSVR